MYLHRSTDSHANAAITTFLYEWNCVNKLSNKRLDCSTLTLFAIPNFAYSWHFLVNEYKHKQEQLHGSSLARRGWCSSTIAVRYILSEAGLVRLVNGPTPGARHTLDVVIAPSDKVASFCRRRSSRLHRPLDRYIKILFRGQRRVSWTNAIVNSPATRERYSLR